MEGVTDGSPDGVSLAPVTRDNWGPVADVAPREDQLDFVPALAARYLLLGLYGDTWHNLGVLTGETVVGHVMWGIDDDGSRWIGGLVIDAVHQGRGLGRRAVELLIDRLRTDPQCGAIRMSHHPENHASRALFESLGFVATGAEEDGELVMELRLS